MLSCHAEGSMVPFSKNVYISVQTTYLLKTYRCLLLQADHDPPACYRPVTEAWSHGKPKSTKHKPALFVCTCKPETLWSCPGIACTTWLLLPLGYPTPCSHLFIASPLSSWSCWPWLSAAQWRHIQTQWLYSFPDRQLHANRHKIT
jgi:hypothetical protein